MEKLNRIKILCKSDLERCPIWVWDETNEYKVPLRKKKELSWDEADTFFIQARFTTRQYTFPGYLIGNETFFAFALFLNIDQIIFNLNAPALNKSSQEKVFQILNCEPFDFFPIHYESDVVPMGGKKISGFMRE